MNTLHTHCCSLLTLSLCQRPPSAPNNLQTNDRIESPLRPAHVPQTPYTHAHPATTLHIIICLELFRRKRPPSAPNLQVKDRFEFPLRLDMRQYTLEGAGALMVRRTFNSHFANFIDIL